MNRSTGQILFPSYSSMSLKIINLQNNELNYQIIYTLHNVYNFFLWCCIVICNKSEMTNSMLFLCYILLDMYERKKIVNIFNFRLLITCFGMSQIQSGCFWINVCLCYIQQNPASGQVVINYCRSGWLLCFCCGSCLTCFKLLWIFKRNFKILKFYYHDWSFFQGMNNSHNFNPAN